LTVLERRRREDTQRKLMISGRVPILRWEGRLKEEVNSNPLELPLLMADTHNKQNPRRHTVRRTMELNNQYRLSVELLFLEEQFQATVAPLNMVAV
jgi:hypothetical protein